MDDISFIDIPEHFKLSKKQIQDQFIGKIYSQIIFLYLQLNKNEDNSNSKFIEYYIFSYLRCFKFIVYQFSSNNLTKKKNNFVNIVIAAEKHCFIIEKINNQLFNNVIDKLKSNSISIINVTPDASNETKEEMFAKEEIQSFCLFYQKEINNNIFVKLTLSSISGYLIRRYFYPTEYFIDQNIFDFERLFNSRMRFNGTKMKEIKTNLSNILFSDQNGDLIQNFINIIENLIDFENNNKPFYHEFKESDFIILRFLHTNGEASLFLVIHIETCYIFMMKK